MSTSLRPTLMRPINWPGIAPGAHVVSTQDFLLDAGTRLGSASRGGGAAGTGSFGPTPGGDYKPGPQFPAALPMPFVAQPGGARPRGIGTREASGLFVPARDVSKGHQGSQGGTTLGIPPIGYGVARPGLGTRTSPGVYGPGQIGSPAQNPRQPYRANAGILIQNRMWPKPLPVHLFGGSKSLGEPTQASVTQQMAALLSMRRSGKTVAPPPVPSSLLGTGIGSRSMSMVGAAFSRR